MTIGSSTPRVTFNCNGVTTLFPINVQAYLAADFEVIHTTALGVETVLTLNSDYSMVTSGSLSPTYWSLTTLAATPYPTGDTLQVFINPTQQQQTTYVQGQAFPSLAVVTNFDRLTQMIQRIQDQVNRCIRAPDGDVSPAMLLPTAITRAGFGSSFDNNGNISLAIIPTAALTQAIFNSFLTASAPYTLTAAETAAGVTPVYYYYPPGDFRRYGADPTGAVDSASAINNALKCNALAYDGYPGGGTYLCNSTIVVPPGVTLKGAGGNSTTGSNFVCGSIGSGGVIVTLGASDTQLQQFPAIADFAITIPSGRATPVTAVLFRATAYASWRNIFVFNNSTQQVTGIILRGGSGGASCLGNTILGGYCQNMHIGVQFTDVGTFCTSATILGLNLLGLSGDATSVGYQFVNANDGFQSVITGGFVEGFAKGVTFNTTKGVVFNEVYFNGNTLDCAWSGNDQYITFVGNPDVGGFTQSGTMGPLNGVHGGGQVNSLFLGIGATPDTSSVQIGNGALAANTTNGLNATAVGKNALAALTTATSCTAVGEAAGSAMVSGNNLTALGVNALLSATGNGNTGVGTGAGSNITTGSNCTVIGNGATASAAAAVNEVTLGNSSVATIRAEVTTITAISDARDKKDIVPLAHGLDLLMLLKPSSFTWNRRDGSKMGLKDHGFIAQELKAAQEQVGFDLGLVYEANPERLEATPGRLIPVLVKAIQELEGRLKAAGL